MSNDIYLRLGSFILILLCFALWEHYQPRRQHRLGYQRWPLNFSLLFLNSLLLKLLIPAGAVGVAFWCSANNFGLLQQITISDTLKVIFAILLLDFFIYIQHVFAHKIPLLWRLHQVHHADCDMDVSTALRFHPLEILLSMLVKMTVVLFIGAPILAVILFEIILNGMAMFNHANIRLPLYLDIRLRWVIATPDMHRIHHSVLRQETDSNYGFNLSIWDRLFHTYTAYPHAGQDHMCIGLAEQQDTQAQKLKYMLCLPFKKQNN